jgi:hypothetical protein
MFGLGKKKNNTEKLELWQARYSRNKTAYEKELNRMDHREALYRGTKDIKGAPDANKVKPAAHVRNVVAELIESQVSSSIPQPKVVALRQEDEEKARLIEDVLRNELDRLPMEYNNDQEERTVPIQGGALSLVEWDSTQRTHQTVGELCVTQTHPKKFIPQDGVWTDIEDMDYFFVLVPQTKAYIKNRYGANVEDQAEEEPGVKGADAEQSAGEDMVTQYMAYYRNDAGGIGLFSWVGDVVLEDLEDYQARRVYVCEKCGERGDGKECAFCGSKKFREGAEDGEELTEDITLSNGQVIPMWSPVLDETGVPRMENMVDTAGRPVMSPIMDNMGQPMRDAMGMPMLEPTTEVVQERTKLPYYKPDVFPVVLRKNVSVFGQFLGDSDVDKIEDQQETIKKLETKAIEKLTKGGSILTIPKDVTMDFTDEELRVLRLDGPEQKALLGVFNLQADVSGDISYMQMVYEEARQIVGITDSFQGRQDRTATSGVAKEFAARQSAGRLESKRAMKDAYYARLFEVMFKFLLAYSDEPRTVVSTDNQGHTKYRNFYRYDFLEQDAAGEWYWNDRFLFSVDASATLANNREGMWQECRMNFQQGAYGNPANLETLVVFWTRMELLHYPGASDTKTYFEGKLKEQQAQQAAMAAMQNVPGMGGTLPQGQGSGQIPGGMEEASAAAAGQIAAQDAQKNAQAAYINGGGRL